MESTKSPVMLIVLDGWGYNQNLEGNAIEAAKTPVFNRLMKNRPHVLVGASGMDVGLPDGQMGNSEVGHLNIGAGRIVYQELTRITKSIKDGDFYENPALTGAVDNALKTGGKLHLLGLVSDGAFTVILNILRPWWISRQEEDSTKSLSMHFWMGGIRLQPAGCVFWKNWKGIWHRKAEALKVKSLQSAAAIMLWTGISAGSGWNEPTTPWSTAKVTAQKAHCRR
jgi:bisphosphoglycerate-independent phosphoglycerate mutase